MIVQRTYQGYGPKPQLILGLGVLLLFEGDGEAGTPDIASLSGCVHVSATLQGRVEIGPTLQGCARIQPTLTGTVETGP